MTSIYDRSRINWFQSIPHNFINLKSLFIPIIAIIINHSNAIASENQFTNNSGENKSVQETQSLQAQRSADVDFCPNTSRFDFRNAYWLGKLSEQAYLEPKLVIPILSTITGAVISFIPFLDRKGKPIDKILTGLGFGSSPNNVKFYTSSKQALGEGTTQPENIHTRWVTPLPAEACIRPECGMCFLDSASVFNDKTSASFCKRVCGTKNTKAYYEKTQLLEIINKLKAAVELSPEEVIIKNQIDKYVNKFKSMKKYEGQNLEINGVPIWEDSRTAERCEQHTFNKEVVPDTQGYVIENDEAIYILFRGTEDNTADAKLNSKGDLHSLKSKDGMKGAVHKGFYLSYKALNNFVENSIEESLKKSPKKPIFITGHSLGGAIGHLTMYNLLSTKNLSFRSNLKAIYTFGSPRVGNKDFAMDYSQKAKEFGVGVYNIANENDIIPHVPCDGYNHVGSMIYLDNQDGKSKIKAIYKPNQFSPTSFFSEPKSCGYSTLVKNLFSASKLFQEHRMSVYIDHLSDLRNQLREQKLACANDEDGSKPGKINLPENIKINFQFLSTDIEE